MYLVIVYLFSARRNLFAQPITTVFGEYTSAAVQHGANLLHLVQGKLANLSETASAGPHPSSQDQWVTRGLPFGNTDVPSPEQCRLP